jgi:hypothetical protein
MLMKTPAKLAPPSTPAAAQKSTSSTGNACGPVNVAVPPQPELLELELELEVEELDELLVPEVLAPVVPVPPVVPSVSRVLVRQQPPSATVSRATRKRITCLA